MSLYCILGISRDADEESIRAAYRVLARRYHPDVGSGSSSEKFREITEAYEILSDPERRRSYDRSLDNPLPAGVRVEHVTVEPMTAPPEPLAPNPFGPRRPLYGDWILDNSIFDYLLNMFEEEMRFFYPPRRRF